MLKFKLILLISCIIFNSYCQDDLATEKPSENIPMIPIEIMAGNKWGMFQNLIAKNFANNKMSFFNLVNYDVAYESETPPNYFIQSFVSYNMTTYLSAGIGANLKSSGGFRPLITVRYAKFTKHFSFVAQPSIETHKNGVFEFFVLCEWNPLNENRFSPFFGFQGSTSYSNKGFNHEFSYINPRIGLQIKNFRFGPALNAKFLGESLFTELNFGGFIAVTI